MVRQEKSSTPTRFVWNTNIAAAPLLAFGKTDMAVISFLWKTNMATVSLFWNTNMPAVSVFLEHQNGHSFIGLEY